MPKIIETENKIIFDIRDQFDPDPNGEYSDLDIEGDIVSLYQEKFPDITLEEIAIKIAEAIKLKLKEES